MNQDAVGVMEDAGLRNQDPAVGGDRDRGVYGAIDAAAPWAHRGPRHKGGACRSPLAARLYAIGEFDDRGLLVDHSSRLRIIRVRALRLQCSIVWTEALVSVLVV